MWSRSRFVPQQRISVGQTERRIKANNQKRSKVKIVCCIGDIIHSKEARWWSWCSEGTSGFVDSSHWLKRHWTKKVVFPSTILFDGVLPQVVQTFVSWFEIAPNNSELSNISCKWSSLFLSMKLIVNWKCVLSNQIIQTLHSISPYSTDTVQIWGDLPPSSVTGIWHLG